MIEKQTRQMSQTFIQKRRELLMRAILDVSAHIPIALVLNWEEQVSEDTDNQALLGIYADWCDENGMIARAEGLRVARSQACESSS
jgi:hypothetical protein